MRRRKRQRINHPLVHSPGTVLYIIPLATWAQVWPAICSLASLSGHILIEDWSTNTEPMVNVCVCTEAFLQRVLVLGKKRRVISDTQVADPNNRTWDYKRNMRIAGRFGGCHLDWTSWAMGFGYISCCWVVQLNRQCCPHRPIRVIRGEQDRRSCWVTSETRGTFKKVGLVELADIDQESERNPCRSKADTKFKSHDWNPQPLKNRYDVTAQS